MPPIQPSKFRLNIVVKQLEPMARFNPVVQRFGAVLRSRGLCLALCLIALSPLAGRSQPGNSSTVNTPQLGRLELENGYPTAATARKLYDELDLQRATQGYLWALPAVGFKEASCHQ